MKTLAELVLRYIHIRNLKGLSLAGFSHCIMEQEALLRDMEQQAKRDMAFRAEENKQP